RKHLHFGIYKGTDLYFKGHESSQNQINQKWLDPNQFLAEQNAQEPNLESIPAVPTKDINISPTEKKSFLHLMIDFVKKLWRKIP
ncbi:MAG: hypothetical protein U0946_01530, partial [Patescibacteria group bacterium]|nr:hypothetical protein [Patescibacteria group bacterium]